MNAYTIPNSLKSFHFQSVVGYRSKAIDASVLTTITFNLVFCIRYWEKAASTIVGICKIFQRCLYFLFNLYACFNPRIVLLNHRAIARFDIQLQ